jgi:peptidoglycan/LPS O-acetylase OafA/YrhL
MSTIPTAIPRKEINFDIEALRGYAALFVVWHHAITYQNLLDPEFTPTGILSYAPSGHFCVLIFLYSQAM